MGVCRGTSKKGGLRHGHNPKKRGVLGTGTSRKRGGGLRHGHESKKGGLKYWSCKKTILVTDVAQKGVLFINYTYFCLVNMIDWWGFTLTD